MIGLIRKACYYVQIQRPSDLVRRIMVRRIGCSGCLQNCHASHCVYQHTISVTSCRFLCVSLLKVIISCYFFFIVPNYWLYRKVRSETRIRCKYHYISKYFLTLRYTVTSIFYRKPELQNERKEIWLLNMTFLILHSEYNADRKSINC